MWTVPETTEALASKHCLVSAEHQTPVVWWTAPGPDEATVEGSLVGVAEPAWEHLVVWESRELQLHPGQKDLSAEPGTERAAEGQLGLPPVE